MRVPNARGNDSASGDVGSAARLGGCTLEPMSNEMLYGAIE